MLDRITKASISGGLARFAEGRILPAGATVHGMSQAYETITANQTNGGCVMRAWRARLAAARTAWTTTVARVVSHVEPGIRWFRTVPFGWLIALSVFSLLFVRPAFLGITLHALFLAAVFVRELMAAADLLAAHLHSTSHDTTSRHDPG